MGDDHSYFVAPSIEYAAQNVIIRIGDDSSLWRDQRGIFAIDAGHVFSNDAEIRIGYEFGYADTRLEIGDGLLNGSSSFTISQLTLEFLRDTLDDSAFPRKGLFLDARVSEPMESLGADATATAFFWTLINRLR